MPQAMLVTKCGRQVTRQLDWRGWPALSAQSTGQAIRSLNAWAQLFDYGLHEPNFFIKDRMRQISNQGPGLSPSWPVRGKKGGKCSLHQPRKRVFWGPVRKEKRKRREHSHRKRKRVFWGPCQETYMECAHGRLLKRKQLDHLGPASAVTWIEPQKVAFFFNTPSRNWQRLRERGPWPWSLHFIHTGHHHAAHNAHAMQQFEWNESMWSVHF